MKNASARNALEKKKHYKNQTAALQNKMSGMSDKEGFCSCPRLFKVILAQAGIRGMQFDSLAWCVCALWVSFISQAALGTMVVLWHCCC